jgi:tetratricopeptide (TPR) repeat protein
MEPYDTLRRRRRPPRPLATLAPPFLADPDLDYRKAFAALIAVEAEIAREGPDVPRVLRRGFARFALGNYLAAAFDAERAARLDPACMEAEFLKGEALLAVAAVKHGVAPTGVGAAVPRRALPPRRHLLLTAEASFRRVLAENPGDAQAEKGRQAARALLHDLAEGPPGANLAA